MPLTPDFTREDALKLLKKYNKEHFHIQHALTLEGVMGYFADSLGYGSEKDYWMQVGLLHDLDFELYPDDHCVKVQEILKESGAGQELIHSITCHGFGLTNVEFVPEHEMEKVLFAVDELTGLLWACALMRPSKSVQDLELKSAKKKFKTLSFAAGCSRETIEKGVEMLGWELDRLISECILAMRSCERSVAEALQAM